MPGFFEQDKTLLIAHRGGAGLYPENTILAFERSVDCCHADAIELDIHATSDGHPVVIHDATVDRTTNGSGRVCNMTLSEIKGLDAGWHFTPDGGLTYPYRGRGLKIPTLREVFQAFSSKMAGINIEIKSTGGNIEKKLYEMIIKYGVADRCLVTASDRRAAARFGSVNRRGVATGGDAFEGIKAYIISKTGLDFLYKPKADVLQLPYIFKGLLTVVTPELAELCRRKGQRLHVWTINNPIDMKKLLNMGVNGIITDYPDRLYKILRFR